MIPENNIDKNIRIKEQKENQIKLEKMLNKKDVRILITNEPMDGTYAIDMPNDSIPQRWLVDHAQEDKIIDDMFSSDIIVYLRHYTIAMVSENEGINMNTFEGVEIFNKYHEYNMVIMDLLSKETPAGIYQLIKSQDSDYSNVYHSVSKFVK